MFEQEHKHIKSYYLTERVFNQIRKIDFREQKPLVMWEVIKGINQRSNKPIK